MTTVVEALKEFTLARGAGSEKSKTACAMTLVAHVRGEGWTDHPPCASRTVCNAIIHAFDADSTTDEQRHQLTLAAEQHAVDTWWLPGEVIAVASALRDGESGDLSRVDRVLLMLERLSAWKVDKSRPVLRGAVLRGAVLSRAVLSGADLRGAVLRDAVLRGAVLRDAVLSGADLRGADLSRAVLDGADLSRADLSDADLRGADLSGAVLRDAVLSGADLSGAVLRDADLSRAVLRDAVLRGADLSRADLSRAVLDGAVLRGAVLRDAVLSGAVLRGAVLRDAVLSGAVGNAYTALPTGWKVSEGGLIVKSEADVA